MMKRERTLLLSLLALALFISGCRGQRPSTLATQVPGKTAIGTEVAASPTAATSATRPGNGQDLVSQGYHILLNRLVLPVQADDLLHSAWIGAVNEAYRQGVTSAPSLPALTGDADADLTTLESALAAFFGAGGSKLDQARVQQAALTSMAEAVDDCHTAYLTADQWQTIQDELAGQDKINDLPLTFQLYPPYLVETVVPGSDADRLGIKPGDRILSLDGRNPDDVPLSQRKFLNVGAPGSSAELQVQSPSGNVRTITVRRQEVDRPLLTTRLIGNVGYIDLRTFSSNLGDQIDRTFASLQAQGARGFVLDLRGNLGGEEDSDVQLLSKFIASGLLATSTGRNGRSDAAHALGGPLPGPPPFAVLVDGGSLSASELFAEAIRQYHAGEIVGTPTPGCLEGSTFRSLDDGSSMQVTAVTVTVGPNLTVVNNAGVQPDVTIPMQASDLASGQDPQLDKAIADVAAQIGP
jgi:carboxyl-terminal processing protease